MPRGRSEQRRQNKPQHPIAHRRNKEKPYGVATERSFDGKGDAADQEQHRQHRLKAKKELASFTLWHLRSPPKHGPPTVGGMKIIEDPARNCRRAAVEFSMSLLVRLTLPQLIHHVKRNLQQLWLEEIRDHTENYQKQRPSECAKERLQNAVPPKSLVCLCDLRLFFFDRSGRVLKQSFSCPLKAESFVGRKQRIDVCAIPV